MVYFYQIFIPLFIFYLVWFYIHKVRCVPAVLVCCFIDISSLHFLCLVSHYFIQTLLELRILTDRYTNNLLALKKFAYYAIWIKNTKRIIKKIPTFDL